MRPSANSAAKNNQATRHENMQFNRLRTELVRSLFRGHRVPVWGPRSGICELMSPVQIPCT
jgi:hypothetical protein